MRLDNDKVRAKLLAWYQENQRVLPWRGENEAYKIWLSEIILQQTRVIQGTPYYLRFIKKFPDIHSLASAQEQEVLKLWQGLGYYSRARNLHQTAKTIVSEYEGMFPANYKDILKLKGIGQYTASAIASIAFNLPYAALDGNVYRVLSRLYGIDVAINANGAKEVFQNMADALLDKKQPGKFNEAMMELGATLCLPKNPLCGNCPISTCCEAKKTGRQNKLPMKNALKKPKSRFLHYLVIKDNNGFYLKHRDNKDIWKGLYDFPLIEKDKPTQLTENEVQKHLSASVLLMMPIKKTIHKLTHQQLEIIFYEINLQEQVKMNNKVGIFVNLNNLKQYPLPKPVELFLNDYLCNPKIW